MHDKFGFKALDKPGFLKPELMKMRLNFMFEELKETAEACGYELGLNKLGEISFNAEPDPKMVSLEDAFDGLLDLEVVLLGTAHLMGFANHVPNDVPRHQYASIWMEGAWRVHQANMAKERCKPGEVGKRGSNHDLIKPKGWKAPTFGDLLR